jgi:hypothetical protein
MDQPHREHGERGDGAHEHDDLVATWDDEVEPIMTSVSSE